MVSRVPDNALGDAAAGHLRRYGVDAAGVATGPGRMGLYFLRPGAGLRASDIVYDREGSAFALAGAGDFDWDALLDGADLLHLSGITPGARPQAPPKPRSPRPRRRAAKGITISFDGNYRAQLWERWDGDPRAILTRLVGEADILFGNHRDISLLLGRDFSGDGDGAAARGGRGGVRRLSEAAADRLDRAPRRRCRPPPHRRPDRQRDGAAQTEEVRRRRDRRPDRRRRRLRRRRSSTACATGRDLDWTRPCRPRARPASSTACPGDASLFGAARHRGVPRRRAATSGAEMLSRRAVPRRRGGAAPPRPRFAAPAPPVVDDRRSAGFAARARTASPVFRGIRYGSRASASRRRSPPPRVARDASRRPASARPRRSAAPLPADERGLPVPQRLDARSRAGARSGRSWSISTAALIRPAASIDPLLDGRHLAARGDVVVVTVNHRLNAFGYLYLARLDPRFPDSGNAGQLDLILALQLDPRQYRRLRRRSGQGHGVRPVGRRRQDRDPDGHARRRRPVPPRGDDERPAGHRLGPAPRHRAGAGLSGGARARDRSTSCSRMPAERLVEGLGATDPILGGGALFRAGARHEMADPPPLLARRQSAVERASR